MEKRQSELWVKLESCIRRIEDNAAKVLFEKKPKYELGLNIEEINRLAGTPIFELDSDDDSRFLIINHPTLPSELSERWEIWSRIHSIGVPNPKKVDRLIEFLRAWQSVDKPTKQQKPAIFLKSALIASPDSSCRLSTRMVLGRWSQPPLASSLRKMGSWPAWTTVLSPIVFSQPAM